MCILAVVTTEKRSPFNEFSDVCFDVCFHDALFFFYTVDRSSYFVFYQIFVHNSQQHVDFFGMFYCFPADFSVL